MLRNMMLHVKENALPKPVSKPRPQWIYPSSQYFSNCFASLLVCFAREHGVVLLLLCEPRLLSNAMLPQLILDIIKGAT